MAYTQRQCSYYLPYLCGWLSLEVAFFFTLRWDGPQTTQYGGESHFEGPCFQFPAGFHTQFPHVYNLCEAAFWNKGSGGGYWECAKTKPLGGKGPFFSFLFRPRKHASCPIDVAQESIGSEPQGELVAASCHGRLRCLWLLQKSWRPIYAQNFLCLCEEL